MTWWKSAIGLALVVELGFLVAALSATETGDPLMAKLPDESAGLTNTEALGQLLYTKYFYLFQAAGIILLIAMVGAIVLTLRQREGVRRQKIGAQVARRRDEAVEIRNVTPGTGI